MSWISNVILVTAVGDGAEAGHPHPYFASPNVARLNEAIGEKYGMDNVLRPVHQEWEGRRALECHIFIGAFNYLDDQWLRDQVRAIDWEEPEHVQLLICDQEDEKFVEV